MEYRLLLIYGFHFAKWAKWHCPRRLVLEAQKLVASAAQLELPDGPRSAKRLRRGASARRGLGMAAGTHLEALDVALAEAFRVVFWINSVSKSHLVFVLDSQ